MTLEETSEICSASALASSIGHSVISGVKVMGALEIKSSLERFEDSFEIKYKVKFEDFVEAMLEDHPELKI